MFRIPTRDEAPASLRPGYLLPVTSSGAESLRSESSSLSSPSFRSWFFAKGDKPWIKLLAVTLTIFSAFWLYRLSTSPDGTLLPSPVSPTPTPISTSAANLSVALPVPNSLIGSWLTLSGSARVFEGVINYTLTDDQGNLLAEGSGQTTATDSGYFGPFSLTAAYSLPKSPAGKLEVFSLSPKDGAVENLVSFPVKFPLPLTPITVFYVRDDSPDCTTVTAVPRLVPQSLNPATKAVMTLIQGPVTAEIGQGLSTAISSQVILTKLTTTNGTAVATFSGPVSETSDNCQFSRARAQITQTLLSFPAIKKVEIHP